MLETKVSYTPISMISEDPSVGRSEVSRLLAAAVINPGFCQLLLNKPELAIKNGFQGEDFLFTKEECEMIASIRAEFVAWPCEAACTDLYWEFTSLYEPCHSAECCFQILTMGASGPPSEEGE